VVLTTAEHLVGAAAALAERLIASCRMCAYGTSRERLRDDGEHVYPVASTHHFRARTPQQDSRISGIATPPLYVDVPRLVFPSFSINETNATAIAKLCRELDGIPPGARACGPPKLQP